MVSGVQCCTKPCSMRILRLGTGLCLFLLQQYSRDTFHRLHALVAFGVRSLLSVSVTAGMCKPCVARFGNSPGQVEFYR